MDDPHLQTAVLLTKTWTSAKVTHAVIVTQSPCKMTARIFFHLDQGRVLRPEVLARRSDSHLRVCPTTINRPYAI